MEKDKSGKFRKYSYMSIHYPSIASDKLEWSKSMGFYGLPYDEILYLYDKGYKDIPKDLKGYKEFRGYGKGYSINGKHKDIKDKFITDSLSEFKKSFLPDIQIKQSKCGIITQKLMENYILMEKLNKKYKNFSDKRIMIHMFLNNIKEIPNCEVCGFQSKERLTNTGFRKTCSEICRRKKEQSYKSYTILHEGEKIRVQGFERFVIPVYLKKYKRADLRIGFEENDAISYFFNCKNRDYYPDLYIPSENLIIEVKSDYSMELDYDKNIAKKESCISKGYNFEFNIWDLKTKTIKII